jgi:hypothetical protein
MRQEELQMIPKIVVVGSANIDKELDQFMASSASGLSPAVPAAVDVPNRTGTPL